VRPLGSHNPRHLRHSQDITFGQLLALDERQRLPLHQDTPLGNGFTLGIRFVAYVYHTRATLIVQMAQFHFLHPGSDYSTLNTLPQTGECL
jgi:hypothetical protein